jgi:thioredoxin reductase (NADPH)
MNYPGSATYDEGRTLLRQLQGIAIAAGAKFKEADVVSIQGVYPKFTVKTDRSYRTKDKSVYNGKTLVFATGTARKHPKVEGKWRLWLPLANVGNGAFYCPDCEAPLCKNKGVIVVNAGTVGSALHVANTLSRFTNNVHILMTEDAYVPIETQDLSRLDKSPFPWSRGKIKSVEFPVPGKIQKITLESGEKLRANVFFVAFVAEPRSELAQSIRIDVDERGNIITDKRGKTNIKGIWAAGDVRPITQQVSMATGTGNYAALMINQFLGNEFEQEEEFDHPECRHPLHMG